MEAKHEGIFKNAEEAITFACNYSSQQYALSPMGRILQRGAYGSGRGLVGLDGAGQAGMVFAEIERLDYWQMLALVAKNTTRSERCDCGHACCRGWKGNPLFEASVSQLADHIATALAVVPPVKRFRVAVLKKHYGEKIDILAIADNLGIARRTSERHSSAIRAYVREIEKVAITRLSEQLDEIGMLTY